MTTAKFLQQEYNFFPANGKDFVASDGQLFAGSEGNGGDFLNRSLTLAEYLGTEMTFGFFVVVEYDENRQQQSV